MKKYLVSTACLMLLLLWPTQAQEITQTSATDGPQGRERYTTISETNYLYRLALRGLSLDSQGFLIESLDGSKVFA